MVYDNCLKYRDVRIILAKIMAITVGEIDLVGI